MTAAQKIGRVLTLAATLVIGSIVVAMIGAVGLFIMEKGREFSNTSEFLDGLGILITGVVVNALCILILIQIRRTDHKVIPPTTGKAIAESQMLGQSDGQHR